MTNALLMNAPLRLAFLAAALVALAACQKPPAPKVENGQPNAVVANVAAVQVGPTKDPSLPDAATVFAPQEKNDTPLLGQASAVPAAPTKVN